MTRPKKLATPYEDVIQHAEYDVVSLNMARHLITSATYKAALRDILRRCVVQTLAKSAHYEAIELNLVKQVAGGPDA